MPQTPQTNAPFQLTRRRFIGSGAATVTLLVHDLALGKPFALRLPGARPQAPDTPTQPRTPPGVPDWSGGPGKARFRIDGLTKVTGQKIYARDFRAVDMPGWPQTERMAMILRAQQPGLAFAGLDLSRLEAAAARPLLTITQTPLPGFSWPQRDLASLNLSLPFSSAGADGIKQLLVPVGAAPQFYGQPVAILIFADANACRRAKRALQFEPGVVKTGAAPPPPAKVAAYSPVNYSQFVAMLAAYCGLSGYDIRQGYVDAIAQPSTGVVAGSMRGFGGPQASFAVETLVDEVAVALERDPIELREINALRQFDRTITGAPLTQTMTLREICRRAREHPLWRERAAVKARKAREGILYGVGFALANQAYGTGKDGVMAEVSMDAAGLLTVRTNCVDMGNGSATTLAISTAGWLGHNAHDIVMGDVAAFNALDVSNYAGGDWSKPNWTAGFAMSSSACLTGFHQVHVTEQASRVLFEAGLLPAAAALWGVPLAQVQRRTRWEAGRLVAPGFAPLPLQALAARVHQMGLTAGAMVHGLYEGAWVSATYAVSAGPPLLLPIDGLSLRAGGQAAWKSVTRQDVMPPNPEAALYGRSLYAPSGVLVAVEIGSKSFEPRVVAIELILDAGKILQPDLLTGQAQGGIAMGIGYALLEDLPLEAGGAGDGRWNLDRYHVALSADVPLARLNITTLPSDEPTAKGIAEAVLCPIAPAIGNAIAHATAKRFRTLPITAADIAKALA